MVAKNRAPVSPACPECGKAGVPVVFGDPSPVMVEKFRDGAIKLGGCMRGFKPVWSCPQDHEWETDDKAQWSAVVDAAMHA